MSIATLRKGDLDAALTILLPELVKLAERSVESLNSVDQRAHSVVDQADKLVSAVIVNRRLAQCAVERDNVSEHVRRPSERFRVA